MDKLRVGQLINKFCLKDNLECYDPYNIWMTNLGIYIKKIYNKNKRLGIIPAVILTIYDHFLNNRLRLFYTKQEYPTVRALAALTLLNRYSSTKNTENLKYAKSHIDWLIDHHCKDYSGLCWGLGFKWAADEGLDYDENTPFTTHTPYVLEAIHKYVQISGDLSYVSHIRSIYRYYESDVQVLFEDENSLGTSYGPSKDRLVTNAVSYTLYAYSILLQYIPENRESIKSKIHKLYNFIIKKQLQDGSWLYEPENNKSFIDCFHSCFILKNIYKSNQNIPLKDCEYAIQKGYTYIRDNFFDKKHNLFKRFSISNKPSIIKYDLYDNSEVMSLSILLGDKELTTVLLNSIQRKFVKGNNVYSVVDIFNTAKNENTLRWAVMPYLYALSNFQKISRYF